MERKVVLVTGGSSGIGLATCQYLLKQHCIVYGTSRSSENGAMLDGVTMLKMDVDIHSSIHEAVQYIIAAEGRIDVLVNNAGTGIAGALEDTSPAELEAAFKTNVFGQLACCQAVIPHMRAAKTGKIINISSIAGEFGLPYRGIYSATKSAIDRVSETLRMELAQWNIHVSIIQPGDYKTNINTSRKVIAASTLPYSSYYAGFKKHYQGIEDDVARAHDPVEVAAVVWRIIQISKPKMRYPAATFWQRVSLSLNRVLPSHLFQKMLVKRYPVN